MNAWWPKYATKAAIQHRRGAGTIKAYQANSAKQRKANLIKKGYLLVLESKIGIGSYLC